eukprot:SAG11_NODE_4943_length_1714_cov_8.600619_2_plen_149_part_00
MLRQAGEHRKSSDGQQICGMTDFITYFARPHPLLEITSTIRFVPGDNVDIVHVASKAPTSEITGTREEHKPYGTKRVTCFMLQAKTKAAQQQLAAASIEEEYLQQEEATVEFHLDGDLMMNTTGIALERCKVEEHSSNKVHNNRHYAT